MWNSLRLWDSLTIWNSEWGTQIWDLTLNGELTHNWELLMMGNSLTIVNSFRMGTLICDVIRGRSEF